MFFVKQYEMSIRKIWGLQFALDGLKEGREILRREYDKLNEDLSAAKTAHGNNEKLADPDKTIREQMERVIETKSREIEEWKKRIDEADATNREVQSQVDGLFEQLPNLEKKIRE